eukprot:TRINITY_DN3736_c0_g1_i2.p1 TRINITY_DN3736_c0_g1~~TRINITY_DN3736_c0_g1_i2.p1  ORF type:complete len:213 (+),score=51.06 TRINITY_DN3736_c0_g1_i2:15-653(+)
MVLAVEEACSDLVSFALGTYDPLLDGCYNVPSLPPPLPSSSLADLEATRSNPFKQIFNKIRRATSSSSQTSKSSSSSSSPSSPPPPSSSSSPSPISHKSDGRDVLNTASVVLDILLGYIPTSSLFSLALVSTTLRSSILYSQRHRWGLAQANETKAHAWAAFRRRLHDSKDADLPFNFWRQSGTGINSKCAKIQRASGMRRRRRRMRRGEGR